MRTAPRSTWRATAVALFATMTFGAGACAPGISNFASFLGDPFGDINESVRDMSEAELEELMSELMLRFRFYLDLREAIPFESLSPDDECLIDSSDTGATLTFVADANCVFGAEVQPAQGSITVTQEQLAVSPVPVFRFELDYAQVALGDLQVDGTERITETDASDGASVRKLDIVQNGFELSYEFRAGLEDGDTPVFDYELSGVLARISNPTTSGGFVSVFLTGIDGTLQCEVRNSLWTPERAPRGTCDNGAVFGLPEDEDEQ